jgi:hypothetical protein
MTGWWGRADDVQAPLIAFSAIPYRACHDYRTGDSEGIGVSQNARRRGVPPLPQMGRCGIPNNGQAAVTQPPATKATTTYAACLSKFCRRWS